jgi:hypothetical protein
VDTGDDIQSDANLAAVLNKTEFMAFNFHQRCGLSQLWGQTLLDMVGHPEFKPEHYRAPPLSTCCGDLSGPLRKIRRLQTTFGSQGTKIRDQVGVGDYYLDVFREIICYPRWKALFDLVFRPILSLTLRLLWLLDPFHYNSSALNQHQNGL